MVVGILRDAPVTVHRLHEVVVQIVLVGLAVPQRIGHLDHPAETVVYPGCSDHGRDRWWRLRPQSVVSVGRDAVVGIGNGHHLVEPVIAVGGLMPQRIGLAQEISDQVVYEGTVPSPKGDV